MRQLVTCPNSAHLEEITVEVSPIDGRILGVIRCSAFSPADTVCCDQRCRHLLNRKLERRSSDGD